MRRKFTVIGISIVLLIAGFFLYDYHSSNPLRSKGLQLEWSNGGVTDAYWHVDAYVIREGERIESPITFGDLADGDLHFEGYNADGSLDLVFREEDKKYLQVVSFQPSVDGSRPSFILIRNDIDWP